MEILIICIVTLLGAGLTLFSGFGLGTLLTPVFGIFFPIEVAIAMTAIVHFANNIFKLNLFRGDINWDTVLRFGIPSVIAAFLGAYILNQLSGLQSISNYSIANKTFSITYIKLIIGILLIFFALIDIVPTMQIQFNKKYLPIGGLISGFFGGLSGNQGAIRSAFLIKAGLTKEQYIATGVMIACMIDTARLVMYQEKIHNNINAANAFLLIAAILSAFVGVYFGNKLFKKMTVQSIQYIVAAFLIIFGFLLSFGII
jgi:uncharacterized protein